LRRSISLALVAIAAIGIAACGSSNKDSSTSTPAAAPAPAATTTTSSGASGGTTLAIAADPSGQLAYDKKTLTAKAGSVTIDFTNNSSTPHNVTIEQGQTEAGATDTIQGSKTSKSFTLKAGTYSFYCSVGNHEAAGMKGTLTVQ
jgi:plastocyanin